MRTFYAYGCACVRARDDWALAGNEPKRPYHYDEVQARKAVSNWMAWTPLGVAWTVVPLPNTN